MSWRVKWERKSQTNITKSSPVTTCLLPSRILGANFVPVCTVMFFNIFQDVFLEPLNLSNDSFVITELFKETHILHPRLRGFLICETHQLHVAIEALQNHIVVACNRIGKSRDSTWFQKGNSAKTSRLWNCWLFNPL